MQSPQRGTKLSRDKIVHRLVFPLVNEGFKILEEGIASDPSDIDIIYLYGYGWPVWKGEDLVFGLFPPVSFFSNWGGMPNFLHE